MHWDTKAIVRNDRFTLIGRRDGQNDPLRLFWVGSGVVMNAKVREMTARIEADWDEQSPWMSVAVDGAPVARFPLRRGPHTYAILTGMDGAAAHRVRLTRDVQPMENDERLLVRLCGLDLDGELLERTPERRLEFVGDSLTSGEGLTGPVSALEWKTAWMSGAGTYAAQLCAALDAEGEWISQSGWGIVTDWTNDPSHTLPRIYGQICGLQAAGRKPHDFPAHPVDAVIVNLGTNDGSALNALPERERAGRRRGIASAVADFLAKIRSLRPDVPILWVCGMCGDGMNALLEQAVGEAAEAMKDGLIAFCPLPACAEDEKGSLGHPGYLSHRRCAAIIAERLREMKPGIW